MSVGERDPHTGHMTTGHEWNGIKELNTPVPKLVLFFLAATAIFSLIYWVLMPAWPLGLDYTRGLLGVDQRKTVAEKLADAAEARATWGQDIEQSSFAEVQGDPALMEIVRHSGQQLFGDNCTACHGTGGVGGPGFPSLADGSWLWGGSPEEVAETLRVGINANHPETRVSEMLAFGRDGMIDRQQIRDIVSYLRVQSGAQDAANAEEETLSAGAESFAANCAACHGENGEGNTAMGAPDLTDNTWIYGGDRQSIYASIFHGRQGHMPAWENRLTPLERKILTLYVLDLGSEAE